MENFEQQIHWLLQEKYDGKLTAAAKKDIMRLKAGEPLDHLIGFVEFLDCKILVSSRALIPRPETEYWVEEAMAKLSSYKVESYKVLDMFSGSGAIGLAVLKHMKNAHVTFVDSEKSCIEEIRRNIKENKFSVGRYDIVQSDVFENIDGKFDLILANPPYIPLQREHKVQQSVLQYEPWPALFGGQDGMLFIKQFLAGAREHLNKGGVLYMEFDPHQKRSIDAFLKRQGYGGWEFHKDQYGRWRFIVVQ